MTLKRKMLRKRIKMNMMMKDIMTKEKKEITMKKRVMTKDKVMMMKKNMMMKRVMKKMIMKKEKIMKREKKRKVSMTLESKSKSHFSHHSKINYKNNPQISKISKPQNFATNSVLTPNFEKEKNVITTTHPSQPHSMFSK